MWFEIVQLSNPERWNVALDQHSLLCISISLTVCFLKIFQPLLQLQQLTILGTDNSNSKGVRDTFDLSLVKVDIQAYKPGFTQRNATNYTRAYLSIILGLFYTFYTWIKCVKQTENDGQVSSL